jgi:hypothetical protein
MHLIGLIYLNVFLPYFADYGLCLFLFSYAASFTDVRISRCVLDIFMYELFVEAEFPWILFQCVRYQCLVRMAR